MIPSLLPIDAHASDVYIPSYEPGNMNGLFRISAKTHLGFILMTKLAAAYELKRLTLKEVADEMMVSSGYLEEVAAALKSAGLVQGFKGPSGGYELSKHPKLISSEDIMTALEGPIELVDCQSDAGCPVEHLCSSKHLWNFLQTSVRDTLRKKSLEELITV